MTSRDRVIASLRHEQPDRTPCCLSFTQPALAAMTAWYGGTGFLGLIDNALELVGPGPGPRQGWLSPTVWQDDFGVHWDRSTDRDIGVVCNCLLPERNLDRLELPDPRDPARFTALASSCAAGRERFVSFAIGFSLFERAWTLRGFENLFLDMAEAPEFVEDLLDVICDYNLALIEQAVQHDIDAVHFGDDWGSQRGILMGPDLWECLLMPRLARQYAAAKRAGKFVTIHSCGKVQEVFPRLIEIGVDCFNPFQPEVMDPYDMKRLYGDRLSFWGGISTQELLPSGTPAEVRRVVRRMVAEVGRDGGYILAPAHDIPGDARPENIMALIEAANEA
ncbi:MAG: uroporphyrinogen decarboxylase [Lentisphaerae bacterium]|nr:uroporphyrinogen decarboxylase [Lentisphaerota bacterium]